MKVYVCTNEKDIYKESMAIFLKEADAQQFKKETDFSECEIKITPYEVIE